MKAVEFPFSMQKDTIALLEALVQDLKSGVLQPVDRGVILFEYQDGSRALWNFGPRMGDAYTAAALFEIGKTLCVDKILV